MKKRVSSTDVAKEAGVSRATVSYVLNNVESVKIKAETREKVLKAAEKLAYHPNSIARALKTNNSMSIGVVSKRDIAEDRFTRILRGIKETLKKYKYSITLCSDELDENGNMEYMNYYFARKIDGVIIISAEEEMDEKLVQQLISTKIPSVLVDYHLNNKIVNCLDIDYYHGAYSATNYLIEKGYERIVYLAPEIDIPQERERLKGVTEAIKDAAKKVKSYRMLGIGTNTNDFEKNIIKTLKKRNDYSALIVSWIHMGYKALYEANRLKIEIPKELGLIALAGSDYANLSFPRLSTSDLPLYEIGLKSAQILIDSIKNDKEVVNESIPCILNPRDST